jgi:hypothetical protein
MRTAVSARRFTSVSGTKRTSSNVRCVVANGGKADTVERRGDLKEMGTGMELASSAEGTSDIQSIFYCTLTDLAKNHG